VLGEILALLVVFMHLIKRKERYGENFDNKVKERTEILINQIIRSMGRFSKSNTFISIKRRN